MGFWSASLIHLLFAANNALVPVTGVVRDADSGRPIAQAVVALFDLHVSIHTDENGRYVFEAPPGLQRVRVQRVGYETQSFEALVPAHGVLEVNVALRREPIELEPIEVRARSAATRGVDFPDRSLSQADLYDDPLLAEPDVLRAVGGGEVAMDPESPSGLHIRGGASDQVGYVLDGIPVFSPYRTAGTFGAWNPDALASVDVIAAAPLHSAPEALSGVVSGHTRAATSRVQTRGSFSATQARASVDGPLGYSDAGYLLSASSAFPGLLFHKDENSHLQGDNLDLLATIDVPVAGGRVHLLGFGSRTDVDVASVAETDTVPVDPARSALGWDSRSLGAEWTQPWGDHARFTLRGWSATGNARAAWVGPDSLEHLASNRRDDGGVAMLAFAALGGETTVGARAQRITTDYSLQPTTNEGRELDLSGRAVVTTAFVEHGHALGARVDVDVSFAAAQAAQETYTSPSAQLRWRATPTLLVAGTAARRQQFAQSLRNSESVVSNIFPVDLFVVAGTSGIPVATSDVAVIAVDHQPNAWLHWGAQAYARDFDSLVLVAPRSADPYADDGFVVGSGASHGFSLDVSASRPHYGVAVDYAYEHVDLRYPQGGYVPNYGASHTVDAGLVFAPSSYTFRLGFQGIVGRRTTATLGALEWEACNMLDGGCEFAGNPSEWSGALGGTALPAYFRLDLGVRKQWDATIAGRKGQVAVFGTATNMLARRNVLTVAQDPVTGKRGDIEMLPPSPLVVGVDWRF